MVASSESNLAGLTGQINPTDSANPGQEQLSSSTPVGGPEAGSGPWVGRLLIPQNGASDASSDERKLPLLYIIPSAWPGTWGSDMRTCLEPLVKAALERGWAVVTPPSSGPIPPGAIFKDYGYQLGMREEAPQNKPESSGEPEGILPVNSSSRPLDLRKVVLLGMGEGADLIARDYYRFYPLDPPMAAVLLSPSVDALALNQLTIPYLVLHGRVDDRLAQGLEEKTDAAVHHHEMRYGDLTRHEVFSGLGPSLGEGTLTSEVVMRILNWIIEVEREPSRPQEPVGASDPQSQTRSSAA